MISEQNNVELLSIKMKTMCHMDSEIKVKSEQNLKLHTGFKRQRSSKITAEGQKEQHQHHSNDHNTDDDDAEDDHYESVVRLLHIDKTPNGSCGFHLTRTKWDPYPWVSGVDCFTPAAQIGLQVGDCVLEVNGYDVLGLRITEIAKLVKSSEAQVTLLLWNSKCNSDDCSQESLCAAPMPRSLQRLSAVVQCVLSVLECPVCLDTITPPAMQCQNGHLLCVHCRIRAESCPVCRDRYYPRPALIAEQLQTAITNAFNLCRNEDKVRQKIFGRHNRQLQMVKTTLACTAAWRRRQLHKSEETLSSASMELAQATSQQGEEANTTTDSAGRIAIQKDNTKPSRTCNKFLTKLLKFKAFSMENLANENPTTAPWATTNNSTGGAMLRTVLEDSAADTWENGTQHRQCQANTNQFDNFIATTVRESNHLSLSPMMTMGMTTSSHQHPTADNKHWGHINSNSDCRKQMFSNGIRHFSLSSNDLTTNPTSTPTAMATSGGKSMETLKPTPSPLATNSATMRNANSISPIWYRQRPYRKYNNYSAQSLPPRALRPEPEEPLKSDDIESSLDKDDICHHATDTAADDAVNDDEITSDFVSLHNSTASTISLKSSSLSSASPCTDSGINF
uniref:RING-type domain-containing protein n=1 Tax=Stomoxys calcitrans TaxID=35570 RepID=A0A1I8NY82_STOCA